LGANPIAIDFNELYTALQTKVVVGTQNSFDAAIKQRFGEVAKYFARTQHAFNLLLCLVNEKKFASLSPENKKIITDAAAENQKKHIQIAFDSEEALAKKLQADFGVTITYPDKTELIAVSRKLMYDKAKKLNVEAEVRKIFD
jgi:TRAP-type C4-dicarboxylate transport system substrate-binding protein